MTTTLTGTWQLVRLALRRDRVRLVVWVVGIVALIVVSGASVKSLYTTQAEIGTYAALVRDNPAIIATSGPGHGLDEPTTGAVLVNESSVWGAIALSLMSIFAVARHTRAEEETGGAEVVRSRIVGRHASSAAALLVAVVGNVMVAGFIAAGLLAIGFGFTGTLALCAAFAAVGVVFATITLVAAQLATTGRGTLGIAVSALGAAFALRAAGDIGDGTLSWSSPIGWAQAIRPFAGERWWVLGLCGGVAVLATCAAFALQSRRDFGGGFVAQRAGPSVASRWLAGPLGLALRLQRSALVAWVLGLGLLGVVYGAVGRDADQLLADQPQLEEILARSGGASPTESFFSMAFLILALVASGFAVSSTLRLRAEESAGRVEPLLATSTSRRRWALNHLGVTAVGSALVVAAGGFGTGAAFALATGDPDELGRLFGSSLVFIPPVLVLVGLGGALYGWVPRATPVAWALLALAVVVGLFGDTFELPQWARNVSPFEHAPALPTAQLAVAPLVFLGAVAVGLTGLGLMGFDRRDIG